MFNMNYIIGSVDEISDSDVVQMWFRCGSDVVQMWFRCGSDVVQMWFRCGGVEMSM